MLVERADGLPADPALTDLGHRQARAMADWLAAEHVQALYVSPLQRARQTAQPLAAVSGRPAVTLDGVAEYDRLHAAYVPIEELKARNRDGDGEGWSALLAGGRSEERHRWRSEVVAVIEEVVLAHRGHKVAVVCHGGVINAYVTHILGIHHPLVYEPYYTSINRVVAATTGERTVATLNEAPWLRDLPNPASR